MPVRKTGLLCGEFSRQCSQIGTQTGCLGNMISKKQPFPFRKIFEKPPFDSFASLYIISIKEFIDLYT